MPDLLSDDPPHIPDYSTREKNFPDFLKELGIPKSRYQIQMFTTPHETILEDDYDAMLVSPETYPVALKINELRKANGRPEIKIIRIEYVMAADDIPISSTRVVHGEIDVHGHLKESQS
ncbi:nucleotidyl transferase family protein [Methanococcoides methylutens]|uniref:hypothetical protein n=1 Tax=Methanococcoides methylutens TaxID=2226 RepID=UPI0006950591|nr:hypothetical protein [Methanococcoides methylutens]